MPKPKVRSSEPLRAREAFEVYYALTPDQRAKSSVSHALLAKRFNVAASTIQSWSTAYKWIQRARERDDEVMSKISQENIKSAVETRIFYHTQLFGLAREWFRLRLENADIREATLATMKVSDLRALIDLDLSIMGDQKLLDYLNGTQESEQNAKTQAKELSTEQLKALAGLDTPRPKNQPVAVASGAAGTGSA